MSPAVPGGGLHLAALWRRLGGGRTGAGAGSSGPGVGAGSSDTAPTAWPAQPGLGVLGGVTPLERVRGLAAAGRQHDSTTCGPAVLTMLAAAGDPALARWLADGVLPASGPVPPELDGAGPARLAALATAEAADRFAVVQLVVRARVTRRAVLGLLPWPWRLGTPPWSAARHARFPGVRYGHTPVDDRDQRATHDLLTAVRAAVEAGVPVPLYTGGDLGHGWATAVPRHLVLVVGTAGRHALQVWEPGAGRVITVPHAVLLTGGRHPGLGGWSRWVWVLVPRLAGGTAAGHDGRVGQGEPEPHDRGPDTDPRRNAHEHDTR